MFSLSAFLLQKLRFCTDRGSEPAAYRRTIIKPLACWHSSLLHSFEAPT